MCALLNNYVVFHKSSIIFTWKSNVSSQLKTNTNLPSWLPRAFTDSVFPVPAGPVNKVKVLYTRRAHMTQFIIFLNSRNRQLFRKQIVGLKKIHEIISIA
jgi:hypothetical protein